jgi:hypothetical protein
MRSALTGTRDDAPRESDPMRDPETPIDVYRRHLRLPPAPVVSLLRGAFAAEHSLAVRGLVPRGTSLVAIARRPALRSTVRSRRWRSRVTARRGSTR